jgi:hypothetical protein
LKRWVLVALLRGRPWRSFRWVLWHHMESLGTKAYTASETRRMLEPLGLTDLRMETYLTTCDGVARRTFPYSLFNLPLAAMASLSGTRLGWFRGITARKL